MLGHVCNCHTLSGDRIDGTRSLHVGRTNNFRRVRWNDTDVLGIFIVVVIVGFVHPFAVGCRLLRTFFRHRRRRGQRNHNLILGKFDRFNDHEILPVDGKDPVIFVFILCLAISLVLCGERNLLKDFGHVRMLLVILAALSIIILISCSRPVRQDAPVRIHQSAEVREMVMARLTECKCRIFPFSLRELMQEGTPLHIHRGELCRELNRLNLHDWQIGRWDDVDEIEL
mmetsp:Transcript_21759/g.61929  ORF Transcript_21759/g.61929 Transcript_21759/m.61929 type:complete len:228 (+) Transcript_21759:943-1626(+)